MPGTIVLTNKETGEKITVSAEEAKRADGSIYTVDPNQTVLIPGVRGETTEVSAEDWINNQQYADEISTSSEDASKIQGAYKYGGVGGYVQTAAESAASGASFGLTDLAASQLTPEYYAESQKRREYNPTAAIGGEILGTVAPALLSGGTSLAASGGRLAAKTALKSAGKELLEQAAKEGVGSAAKRGVIRTIASITPAGATSRLGVATEQAVGRLIGATKIGKVGATAIGGASEGAVALGTIAFNQTLAQTGDVDAAVEAMLSSAGAGAVFGGITSVAGSAVGSLLAGKPTAEIVEEGLSSAKKAKSISGTADDVLKSGKTIDNSVPTVTKNEAIAAQMGTSKEVIEQLRPGATADDTLDMIDDVSKTIKVNGDELLSPKYTPEQQIQRLAKASTDLEKKLDKNVGVISKSLGPRDITTLADFLDNMDEVLKTAPADAAVSTKKIRELFKYLDNQLSDVLDGKRTSPTIEEMWDFRKTIDQQLKEAALDNDANALLFRNAYDGTISQIIEEGVESNPSLSAKVAGEFSELVKQKQVVDTITQGSKIGSQVKGFSFGDVFRRGAKYAGVDSVGGALGKFAPYAGIAIPAMSPEGLLQYAGVDRQTAQIAGGIAGLMVGRGKAGKGAIAAAMRAIRSPTVTTSIAKAIRSVKSPTLLNVFDKKKDEPIAQAYGRHVVKLDNRISELETLSQNKTLQPVEAALAKKQLAMAQYLRDNQPALIGIDPLQPAISEPVPDPTELQKYKDKVQVVQKPTSIVENLASNTLTLDHVDALRENYPILYKQMQEEVYGELKNSKTRIPQSKRYALGLLLDIPTSYDLGNISSMQAGFVPTQNDPNKVPIKGNMPNDGTMFKLD